MSAPPPPAPRRDGRALPLRFTLRQLEYFIAVGEAGSIALAAQRVNVSSPSISTAISQLEGDFGLPLFVRKHAQGLALTQAGRQMLAQARQVLAQAEALNRLAGEVSGSVQGPLAVGCLLTFAQLLLPQLRRRFEDDFPAVRIRQFELNQQDIFAGLLGGTIDVALTYDLEIPPTLRFIPLVELPPYVLVADTHPLAGLDSVTAGQLREHPMVMLDLPFSSDYFLSLLAAEGVTPRIAERTRDMAVMRSLVANGYGYAIANIRPLHDLAPDGRKLRFVPLVGAVRPMMLGLALVEGADAVLTLRAFVEHCRALITDASIPGMNMRPPPNR